MALEDQIKDVLDFVVATTKATWTDATVTKEDPKMKLPAPIVWVHLQNMEFDASTVRSDNGMIAITVHGRFASLTTDQRIERSSQLRTALLTLGGDLDGVAHKLEVREFDGYSQSDMLDPAKEVGLLFMCEINVPRVS